MLVTSGYTWNEGNTSPHTVTQPSIMVLWFKRSSCLSWASCSKPLRLQYAKSLRNKKAGQKTKTPKLALSVNVECMHYYLCKVLITSILSLNLGPLSDFPPTHYSPLTTNKLDFKCQGCDTYPDHKDCYKREYALN